MKMKLLLLCSTLLVLPMDPGLGDEAAVREMLTAYVNAFNDRKLDVVTDLWTEDASHQDRASGEVTVGRDAIGDDIDAALAADPGIKLSGSVERVRMITPSVASVQGETTVSIPDEQPETSEFTAIVVDQEGKWRLSSVDEMPLLQPPTPYDALRELELLIGQWIEDSGDAVVETSFRWSAGQSFLVRSYVSTSDDGDGIEGTQVIGWDPRAQHIRSWTFNSDGSFGDAVWSQNGDNWLIKSTQTLADGRAASGTYVLEPVHEDEITIQLIGHEVEGEPQPQHEAVTITRVSDQEAAEDDTSQAAKPSTDQPASPDASR